MVFPKNNKIMVFPKNARKKNNTFCMLCKISDKRNFENYTPLFFGPKKCVAHRHFGTNQNVWRPLSVNFCIDPSH